MAKITMKQVMDKPAGKERMALLKKMKEQEAAEKKAKDTRTTKEIAPKTKEPEQVKTGTKPKDAKKAAKEGESRAQRQRRLIEEETKIKGEKFKKRSK